MGLFKTVWAKDTYFASVVAGYSGKAFHIKTGIPRESKLVDISIDGENVVAVFDHPYYDAESIEDASIIDFEIEYCDHCENNCDQHPKK